jgi:hypothetical protein
MIEFGQFCGFFSLIRFAAAIAKVLKTAAAACVPLNSLACPEELVVS